jgi:hypothetical protein
MTLLYLFKVLKQLLPGLLNAIIESLQDYVKVSVFITLFF